MSQKTLAVRLSRLQSFSAPKARLEQYATDSEVAAELIHSADMLDGLEGKHVLDLGAGTGILGIGAALREATVTLLDIDDDALTIARQNAKICSEADITFLCSPVRALQADIVVMNPPFGVQTKHADKAFLDAAMQSAPVVYALLDGPSEQWACTYLQSQGYKVTHAWKHDMLLPKTMSHHKKKRARIPVVVLRSEKQAL